MKPLTQEAQREIREQWEQTRSIHAIAKTTGVSRPTIRNYLKKWGITPNPPDLARSTKTEIIKVFLETRSIRATTKITGAGKQRIQKILKSENIKCEAPGFKRIYDLDETCFNKETPERNYFIGMLFADGNVSQKSWAIKLQLEKTDIDCIQKFKNFLKTNIPIEYRKKSGKIKYASIRVTSKKIWMTLFKFGITPKKSRTATPPKELENNRDFWRGVIDGDGGVYLYRRKRKKGRGYPNPQIRLGGTPETIEAFTKFCELHLDRKPTNQPTKKPWHNTVTIYNSNAQKIAEILYGKSKTHLLRKKLTAIQIKKWKHKSSQEIPS